MFPLRLENSCHEDSLEGDEVLLAEQFLMRDSRETATLFREYSILETQSPLNHEEGTLNYLWLTVYH